MKSTGLFGKNSGRIGGVVYSNYRGQQIVRSYQPQVKNPKSSKQVEQRARFKLVSQVSASLSREIKLSFVPNQIFQTPRNAFIKEMLKKTSWDSHEENAKLPIEEIVLTNSRDVVITNAEVTPEKVTGTYDTTFAASTPMVHLVQIGYSEGGEVQILGSWDFTANADGTFDSGTRLVSSRLSGQRVLIYLYTPSDATVRFEDYIVFEEEANLYIIKQRLAGNIRYTATYNALKPANV